MRILSALVIAFATYSRIPMPQVGWSEENQRYALCFFPLVGAVLGVCMYAWLKLCALSDAGPLLRGAGCAVLPLLITGGIHMDGLMDASDALASRQSREKGLEILKDSHVGAFAVIVCAAYLLLFAAVMSEAALGDALSLGTAFVASRAVSAISSVVLKHARADGMLRSMAKNARQRAVVVSGAAYLVACLAVWALSGVGLALLCCAVLLICALCYRRMAYRRFGGVTGDLAGWLLQVAELALAFAIVMGGKLL